MTGREMGEMKMQLLKRRKSNFKQYSLDLSIRAFRASRVRTSPTDHVQSLPFLFIPSHFLGFVF